MQVQVKLKNGIITSIPNVMWHPEFTAHLEPGIGTPMPAGCWVRKSTVAKFVAGTVREIRPSTVDKFIESIEFAEMPFEILDDEHDEPWRNFGNCVKAVPYGGFDFFWKRS